MGVISKNLEFESFVSFKEWKSKYEAENKTRYNLMCGSDKDISSTSGSSSSSNVSERTVYYTCHRSGYYHSAGKGSRHLKTQGSKKIDGYCPSQLKAKLHKDGKCSVEFVSTHVGHVEELAHITLSPYERSTIAAKIASKVPFVSILDEVRDSITKPDDLSRIHLLTRKDLHNIETGFNLTSESVRHQSDPISVDAWVKQMRAKGGDDCILYYKAQGQIDSNYPFLAETDFMLAIMNDAQASMFEKYGSDAVCVDGTHGLNAYDFELITLAVIDDMRQGFPCGFFFTNRTDKEALEIFYTKIKERLGGTVPTPDVFMSDMAESFYNAWIQVMNVPRRRLYCTWHVDRAWRKNLGKIELTEKKVEVYKLIRSLLEERDAESFSLALELAVAQLKNDAATKDFGIYFHDNYAKNPDLWAYCYRLHSLLSLTPSFIPHFFHNCLLLKRTFEGVQIFLRLLETYRWQLSAKYRYCFLQNLK